MLDLIYTPTLINTLDDYNKTVEHETFFFRYQ